MHFLMVKSLKYLESLNFRLFLKKTIAKNMFNNIKYLSELIRMNKFFAIERNLDKIDNLSKNI